MIQAQPTDKNLIIDILCQSFDNNRSVNYLIEQDSKRKTRLEKLMAYSFDTCHRFGKVFLSEDKNACALILLPEKKKTTLYSLYLDLNLALFSIGLPNVKRAAKRESAIKERQLKLQAYYLWFIGVYPDHQLSGIGSILLSNLINDADSDKRTIILETSTLENIRWYQKFGFSIYDQLDFGFPLFFLRK